MPRTVVTLLIVLLIPILSMTVRAQDVEPQACLALVQQAYTVTQQACAGTGRDEACYGNLRLDAQPDTLSFSQTGDTVPVTDLQSLRLSSMNTDLGEWGVSLMRVRASLPEDSVESVELLLFGNVDIQSLAPAAAAPNPTVQLTARNSVNVRSSPSTSAAIVTSLQSGATVTADGRNEAGDWARVNVGTEDAPQIGWVFSSLFDVQGDLETLVVTAADAEPVLAQTVYGPMQAFTFTSGVDDRPCAEAPDSGILIQTPEGAGRISFEINEVILDIGSTVYMQFIQLPAGGQQLYLSVSVLDGYITATVSGQTVSAPAGSRVLIPVDTNFLPNGAPLVEPYDDDAFTALQPAVALLAEPITIAAPLTGEALNELAYPTVPLTGYWQAVLTENIPNPDCGCITAAPVDYQTTASVTVSADRQSVTLSGGSPGFSANVQQTAPGDYAQSTDSRDYHLTIISPREMRLEQTGNRPDDSTWVWHFMYLEAEAPTATSGPLTPGQWSFTPTGTENDEMCLSGVFPGGEITPGFVDVSQTGNLLTFGFAASAGADEGDYQMNIMGLVSLDAHIDTPTHLTGTIILVGIACTITFEGTLVQPSFSAMVASLPPVDATIIPLSGEWTATVTSVDVYENVTCASPVTTMVGRLESVMVEVSQDGQQITLIIDNNRYPFPRQPNGYYVATYEGVVYGVYEALAPDHLHSMSDTRCSLVEEDWTLNP